MVPDLWGGGRAGHFSLRLSKLVTNKHFKVLQRYVVLSIPIEERVTKSLKLLLEQFLRRKPRHPDLTPDSQTYRVFTTTTTTRDST